MEKEYITTYVQLIRDARLLDIAKEAASIYNYSKQCFWNEYNISGKFINVYEIQKRIYPNITRQFLSSASCIENIQQFGEAITNCNKAKKEYKKNPSKFSGEPKYPTEDKITCPIYFRKDTIRYKNKYLLLSLAKDNNPIKIRWNLKKLGLPKYIIISWKKETGWQASLVVIKKTEQDLSQINNNKILAGDLGSKRIITTFDGTNAVTYSGKKILSLTRLRNKKEAETKEKLSKLTKHSRKYKKIKRASRKVTYRIKNQVKDVLHKTSRTVVNYCIENEILEIVFGECSDIHNETNLGKVNNQKVQQNPEQKLRKLITSKFEVIGGVTRVIPENYTSRTCPNCGDQYKPSNRVYKCSGCGFTFDRDGVGSINIWGLAQNVSLGKALAKANVVGSLTEPIGWKYHASQDCLVKLKTKV